ncbi:MAG: methyltransferase domain-containing protein [Caulobacteraceae bacterium]|nr:methyltransferase domain-containing protein [Caulobacteraceae bacterium]
MSETSAANAAQIDYWNAQAGQTWAQFQEQLDRQIEPLGREAMRVLAPRPGEAILDIGCGCGQTTVELAARVGPAGEVLGADISEPMLAVARARPAPAGSAASDFRLVDAQTGDLGAGAFDAAFSRFGVMFFSDPPSAFANIRKALKPGGRLTFVCWRPYLENPWMRAPMEAAAALLPPTTPPDPTAPGPFAFADPERVRGILTQAGFKDIAIAPYDAKIGGGDIDQTLALAFRVGPLGAALRENPDRAADVTDAVRAALESYVTPEGVLMPSAVWVVQASAG